MPSTALPPIERWRRDDSRRECRFSCLHRGTLIEIVNDKAKGQWFIIVWAPSERIKEDLPLHDAPVDFANHLLKSRGLS